MPGKSYMGTVRDGQAGQARDRAARSCDRDNFEATAQHLAEVMAVTRRGEAPLIRTQAALLSWLNYDPRLRLCGFTSVSDLASEVLGLRPRTVRERMSLHRVCTRVPAIERALLDGHVSSCQILAIEPVLTTENAGAWMDLAKQCSVRELRWWVRRTRKEDGVAHVDGRMVDFEAPVSFQPAFDQMMELARCVLGRDAPRHECMGAVLAEAGFAGRVQEEHALPPPAHSRLRPDPSAQPEPEELEAARATLEGVQMFLQEVDELCGSGEPADPMDALVQLRRLAVLSANQRVLFARLMQHLRRLNAVEILGYRSMKDLVEDRFGISERTARNRVEEAVLFERNPDIERAVATGQLNITQAHWIRRMGRTGNYGSFARRAQSVTRRQFERECRLYELLRVCGLAAVTRQPLPQPGFETAVAGKLGWSTDRMEEELARRGVTAPPSGSSQDPAENPIVMERLEAMVEALALSQWDEVPLVGSDMPPAAQLSSDLAIVRRPGPEVDGHMSAADGATLDGRVQDGAPACSPASGQVSAACSSPVDPDARVTIRFWAPHPIADDFWNAIGEIRGTAAGNAHVDGQEGTQDGTQDSPAGTILPVWAAVALLFAPVAAAWNTVDPATRPARARILRRDRYHCVVPGCSSRRMLTKHHTRFRSHGGGNEDENLSTVCHPHHAHGIHEGHVRLTGPSPHGRHFELGCRLPGGPLLVLDGQKVVRRPWPLGWED